jgi:ribosomal protein S6--L-glutamate ligase
MRIAIFSTRSARYHPNRRLLEAARSLGHSPVLLHPKAIMTTAAMGKAALPDAQHLPDVLLPRIGSTIDDTELAAVFHMERLGIPVINGFHALVIARDKYLSLRHLDAAGIPVPRTFLVTAPERLASAIQGVGGFPVVIKASRGRQGTGVHLVHGMSFARYILDHPPRPGQGVLVQEYLPSAEDGDIRIIVVGGRPVAWMKRVPPRGEFRANVHLRGKGHPWSPLPDWVQMAAKATRTLGLEVAGVDLLERSHGPVVLEVNTNPGFREMERVTGLDVAEEIVRHATDVAKGR